MRASLCLLLFVPWFVATASAESRRVTVDRVVAIVEDSVILASELELQLVPARAQAEQIADPKERARRVAKLRSQVLDEMIGEELVVQAAEARKLDISAEEIRAAIEDTKQQNGFDDAQLAEALSSQGLTMDGYRRMMRRMLLRHRAINELVAPKVTISDDDLRARYAEMQRRTDSVSSVAIAQILFALPAHPTEQQLAAAQARAAAALARARAGEQFAVLAAELSDDATTKSTGGTLGWFERGTTDPEWEKVVFAMDKGDVRGPVKSERGLHVLLATDVKRSSLKPFAEMKPALTLELRRRAVEKAAQSWLEDLRKKAYIEIKP